MTSEPVVGHRGWMPLRSGDNYGLRSLCARAEWWESTLTVPHTPRASETIDNMAEVLRYTTSLVFGTVVMYDWGRDWELYAKTAVIRSLYVVGPADRFVAWFRDPVQGNTVGGIFDRSKADRMRYDAVRLAKGGAPSPLLAAAAAVFDSQPEAVDFLEYPATPLDSYAARLEERFDVPVVHYAGWEDIPEHERTLPVARAVRTS